MLKNPWVNGVLLFLVVGAWFGYLHAAPSFPDPDAYYHAKLAMLMRDTGLVLEKLPWASETILADRFVDHHFLYHLILIPFVTVLGPLIGIKVLTALSATLVIVALWIILRRLAVPRPWFFIALALATEPFITRMNLAKASAFVVLWLLLTILALLERRHWLLFVLALTWPWLHGSFIYVPVLAFLWYLVHRLNGTTTASLRPFVLASLGVVIGTVLSPYFPANINFFFEQSIRIPWSTPGATNAGAEWYPYPFESFTREMLLFFMVAVISAALFFLKTKSRDHWFLGILATILFLLTFKSRRTVEYAFPVALLAIAVTLRETCDVLHIIGGRLRPFLVHSPRINWGLFCILGGLLLTIVIRDTTRIVTIFQAPHPSYAGASAWLAANTPHDTLVFHTRWDTWPMLFYWNTHNRYLVGLDPRLMQTKNPAQFMTWMHAINGDTPVDLIPYQFGTRTILIEKPNIKLLEQATQDGAFEKQYEDEEAMILTSLP